jgi:hypothetical protein
MTNSAEKLVKQTIKLLAKTQELDYEELKVDAKKLIKIARNYDETLLGLMEELLDLGNIGSPEEISEFSIETLKVYCKIKEIDDSGSDRTIRSRVWRNIEEEFELDSDDEEGLSEDDELSEIDENDELSEIEVVREITPVPQSTPEPVPVSKKTSKKKKEVVIE